MVCQFQAQEIKNIATLAQTGHLSSTLNNLGPSVLSPFEREDSGISLCNADILLVTSHEKVVADNLKTNYRHLSCNVLALYCPT